MSVQRLLYSFSMRYDSPAMVDVPRNQRSAHLIQPWLFVAQSDYSATPLQRPPLARNQSGHYIGVAFIETLLEWYVHLIRKVVMPTDIYRFLERQLPL